MTEAVPVSLPWKSATGSYGTQKLDLDDIDIEGTLELRAGSGIYWRIALKEGGPHTSQGARTVGDDQSVAGNPVHGETRETGQQTTPTNSQ